MTIEDLKNIISECLNDVLFSYDNKQCGVTSEVNNYIPVFTMWFGDKSKEFSNVDDLMNEKMFNGKSIVDLIETIEFSFA